MDLLFLCMFVAFVAMVVVVNKRLIVGMLLAVAILPRLIFI